jgi:hypothetical protein
MHFCRRLIVPGDPRECRMHATRCAELAAMARTEELKVACIELSKNWENLAISLEKIQNSMHDDLDSSDGA